MYLLQQNIWKLFFYQALSFLTMSRKLQSYSYCCRKHLILGSFVINTFLSLLSLSAMLLGNRNQYKLLDTFFPTCIHMGLWKVFHLGIYFFMLLVIESGQTVIFLNNCSYLIFITEIVLHYLFLFTRKLEFEVTPFTEAWKIE